jgi:hybrid cluster-associated redox disulfide protein
MVSISESLQAKLADRVASRLASRRKAGNDLRAAAASLRLRTRAAQRARAEAHARLLPFTADTTVHQAWARHPGVAEIFGRYNLNDCPSCSVGADESLKEAAFGYEMDVVHLMAELNALLEGC